MFNCVLCFVRLLWLHGFVDFLWIVDCKVLGKLFLCLLILCLYLYNFFYLSSCFGCCLLSQILRWYLFLWHTVSTDVYSISKLKLFRLSNICKLSGTILEHIIFFTFAGTLYMNNINVLSSDHNPSFLLLFYFCAFY